MPQDEISPGRQAVLTKGQEELDRAGRMAAWTRRFSTPEGLNPYSRDNYYRHKSILDPFRSAYWRATWDCRSDEEHQWAIRQQELREQRNTLDDKWAVHNTKTIKNGDRLFLIRQTKLPRGIVAVGTVIRTPYPGLHWRPDRAAAGDETNYVDVRWDVFQAEPVIAEQSLPPNIEPFVQWKAPRSGTELDRHVGFYLDQEVLRRLNRTNTQSAANSIAQSKYFGGGESDAHRALKDYVARNPSLIGIRADAIADVEHQFRSPDRADLIFYAKDGTACAVEIELHGAQNTLVGAWQALKYKLLLELELGHDIGTRTVTAFLVANEIPSTTREFCNRYGVEWREIEVPPEWVTSTEVG